MLKGTTYQAGEWKQATSGSPKMTITKTTEAVTSGNSDWNLWTWQDGTQEIYECVNSLISHGTNIVLIFELLGCSETMFIFSKTFATSGTAMLGLKCGYDTQPGKHGSSLLCQAHHLCHGSRRRFGSPVKRINGREHIATDDSLQVTEPERDDRSPFIKGEPIIDKTKDGHYLRSPVIVFIE